MGKSYRPSRPGGTAQTSFQRAPLATAPTGQVGRTQLAQASGPTFPVVLDGEAAQYPGVALLLPSCLSDPCHTKSKHLTGQSQVLCKGPALQLPNLQRTQPS